LNSKSKKEDYKVELSDKQKEIVSFFFDKDLSEVIESLNEMSNTKYRKIFKGTSLERTGRVGILKNLEKLFSNE
jgi:epoxyqueuosine reductase